MNYFSKHYSINNYNTKKRNLSEKVRVIYLMIVNRGWILQPFYHAVCSAISL